MNLNNGRFDNTTDKLVTCLDCKATIEKRYKDEHVCFAVRFTKPKRDKS